MWRLRLITIGIGAALLLGWWGYTKLLIHQRDEARKEASVKPIEATARVEHSTAIERIKEIEEEFDEGNTSDGNGTLNLDWMW